MKRKRFQAFMIIAVLIIIEVIVINFLISFSLIFFRIVAANGLAMSTPKAVFLVKLHKIPSLYK